MSFGLYRLCNKFSILEKVHEISLLTIARAAHQLFAGSYLSVWVIKGLKFL